MRTALLIIDMQNFFAEMVAGSKIHVLELCSYFRAKNMPQYFTQHGHSQDELMNKKPNQLVRKWGASGSIATGSEDWQLIPEIADAWSAAGKPPIVAKNTYDAFINTDLETRLRDERVERLLVVGVMTDCCCDTTARSAFNRGFETWLINDACGTASEAQHKAALKSFKFAFGEVIDTATALKKLREE
ncbi:uncharacterized protein PV09_08978 [Verruconis gallopava]|uniref:Isochorismatase-like domain-containing protein n=1 Tax=Verruconis gallopava TaxID=253628 RepID=A0A0D2AK29_9PEZI|nr:uncharacterized protein PV09_08978 [Verruconis gallopava]KIV99318.1 hypothetical protein PV09_08978 [Verruconis gallopava]